MVRLDEKKHSTEHKAIQVLKSPDKVYIPLSQHIGKICTPLVKVSDKVLRGQVIASAQAVVTASVHASVSGSVVAIEDWPHPVLGRVKAIVIENDFKDEPASDFKTQKTNVDKLSPEEIRTRIADAGIVGMGGASFPSVIKLTPPKPVDTLIINGAECEPYLTSDSRLMIEKAQEIIKVIPLIQKCINVKTVYIAIEDNKPQAIKALQKAAKETDFIIKVLPSQYPQGGEKQLIWRILNKQVPSEKLPFEVGVVVHNVATVYAMYEALFFNKPLYERVVTVGGDCLSHPANFLVRIGTPARFVLEQTGFKQPAERVLFGGPMMGIAQFHLDAPIIKSTNGITCLYKSSVFTPGDAACIRCGRCVENCPVGLQPCLISLASRKEKWDIAKAYNCLDCIECGLCSYVCPQQINLVQSIKVAKARAPR